MATSTDSLRLVSFNCRGWNSGSDLLSDIASTFDLCFVQEHWLFDNQLYLLDFHTDFSSCGVSGMEDVEILKGRPYGGCGIIFRKSLLKDVRVLSTPSNRFCSVNLHSGNLKYLLICVYLPTDYHCDSSSASFYIVLVNWTALFSLKTMTVS